MCVLPKPLGLITSHALTDSCVTCTLWASFGGWVPVWHCRDAALWRVSQRHLETLLWESFDRAAVRGEGLAIASSMPCGTDHDKGRCGMWQTGGSSVSTACPTKELAREWMDTQHRLVIASCLHVLSFAYIWYKALFVVAW